MSILLPRLRHLSVLELKNCCDSDDILIQVGRTCHHLTVLKISGRTGTMPHLSGQGIHSLCCICDKNICNNFDDMCHLSPTGLCATLKHLELQLPKIPFLSQSLLTVLILLKNLVTINCNHDELSEALQTLLLRQQDDQSLPQFSNFCGNWTTLSPNNHTVK